MRVLFENPSNKQKEQSFFETFLAHAPGIPEGSWHKSESPDYILEADERVFGIEVTTLMRDNPSNNTPLAAIRDAQIRCLQRARTLLQRSQIQPVQVKVNFRDDNSPIDVEEAAMELSEFVTQKIGIIDDSKTWAFHESGLKNIKTVFIHLNTTHGKRWLEHHRVGPIHMNWISVDPVDLVQRRIDEKQRRIFDYLKKCDECWLIIGVDEWTAPEAIDLTENGISHRYRTDFSRLFFVRNIDGKVYELSTAPWNQPGKSA